MIANCLVYFMQKIRFIQWYFLLVFFLTNLNSLAFGDVYYKKQYQPHPDSSLHYQQICFKNSGNGFIRIDCSQVPIAGSPNVYVVSYSSLETVLKGPDTVPPPNLPRGPTPAEIAARQKEIARQVELVRLQEIARQAELVRQQEAARKAEEAKLRRQHAQIDLIKTDSDSKLASQEVELFAERKEAERVHDAKLEADREEFLNKLKTQEEARGSDSKALHDKLTNLTPEEKAAARERFAQLKEAKRLDQGAAINPAIQNDLGNPVHPEMRPLPVPEVGLNQPQPSHPAPTAHVKERLSDREFVNYYELHSNGQHALAGQLNQSEQVTVHEDLAMALVPAVRLVAGAAKGAIVGGAKAVGREAAEILCFPGETEVCLKGEKSQRIDGIKVGDYVEACDLESEGNTCERRRVQKVFKNTTDHLLELSFGGKKLRTTDNHPFYVVNKGTWVEAKDLVKGDRLRTRSGHETAIENIRSQQCHFNVFNLEVEKHHNYYAGGVLVHNCNEAGSIGTGAWKGVIALQAETAAAVQAEKAVASQVEKVIVKEVDSAGRAKVWTPHGDAFQEMTSDALAAKNRATEGATLYRVGTRKINHTGGNAQFWSLEHPNTAGYAERHGIPHENVIDANFIETATVKPNTSFVTRAAPGVGKNHGGAIEAVVPEGGVTIKSHTSK